MKKIMFINCLLILGLIVFSNHCDNASVSEFLKLRNLPSSSTNISISTSTINTNTISTSTSSVSKYPTPINLNVPNDGCINDSFQFSWSGCDAGYNYSLEISTDSTYWQDKLITTNGNCSSITGSTNIIINNVGDYFWRIKFYKDTYESDYTIQSSSFTVTSKTPIEPSTLNDPSDDCVGNTFTVTWNSEQNYGTYEISASADSTGWTNPIIGSSLSKNSGEININTEGTYWWRVRHKSEGCGDSNWIVSSYSFNVIASPTNPAISISFADSDLDNGELGGEVNITKAADESDITHYVLYFGSDSTTKNGSAIAEIGKTGSDLTHTLSQNTVPESGSTHLLVFTKNNNCENNIPVNALLLDNYARYIDVSAGQPNNTGQYPSAVIDFTHNKLLIATRNLMFASKPSLFRCDLDGTNSSHTDISAGQGTNSGYDPSAVIDTTNNKFLVVTCNSFNSKKPGLFLCNLDGTSSSHIDISVGQGSESGWFPNALIDTTNSKLLVVTQNNNNSYKPSLFRCDLDGTNCSHHDISAGQAANSGQEPNAVIDTINNKLLVVTRNGDNSSKPSLFRCDLDGTNCSHHDISAGQGNNCGVTPNAVIDTTNSKLLVVTNDLLNSAKLSLFRCDLDGTNCSYYDISTGINGSGENPSAIIDTINDKLLVVTHNTGNSGKPGLFRCDLDGTNCSHSDISAGQGSDSGDNPSAVIDYVNNKLLVATQNGYNSDKPGLFWVYLW